jgi:hypothetical protein
MEMEMVERPPVITVEAVLKPSCGISKEFLRNNIKRFLSINGHCNQAHKLIKLGPSDMVTSFPINSPIF